MTQSDISMVTDYLERTATMVVMVKESQWWLWNQFLPSCYHSWRYLPVTSCSVISAPWTHQLFSVVYNVPTTPSSSSPAADTSLNMLLSSLFEFLKCKILVDELNAGHITCDFSSQSFTSPFRHKLTLFICDTLTFQHFISSKRYRQRTPLPFSQDDSNAFINESDYHLGKK